MPTNISNVISRIKTVLLANTSIEHFYPPSEGQLHSMKLPAGQIIFFPSSNVEESFDTWDVLYGMEIIVSGRSQDETQSALDQVVSEFLDNSLLESLKAYNVISYSLETIIPATESGENYEVGILRMRILIRYS